MERRNLLAALAGSAFIGSSLSAAEEEQNTILELKTWLLHNSAEDQSKRLTGYLQHGLAPALERAGLKLNAAFGNLIGESGPYIVTVVEYPNLAAFGQSLAKIRADSAHTEAAQKLASGSGAPFVRVDSTLLRSFDVMPRIATAPAASSQGTRIFEMRTYESPSFAALTRKVAMFNQGEAKIFERLGMQPVFFGEAFAGPRQPKLTYMLSYESLAARDELWKKFGSDPEWNKLRATPGLSDAEIVSNISNVILRPLAFSAIR